MSALAAPAAAARGREPRDGAPGWPFACPACLRALAPDPDATEAGTLRCPEHGAFPRSGGILRALTSDRAALYGRFMREYAEVRRREGRGAADAAYYRALPFRDLSGRLADQWRIRAGSYRALVARVLGPLERRRGGPLDVLDLGAGNGWLAHRLARRGHRVAALDLGDDPLDGLGAHRWYAGPGEPPAFTPVEADFDRLPFAGRCADLVVFNASLHYSTDLEATLAEAVRVLRPDGRLVVLDTPVYRSAASGRAMVRERERDFVRRFGFPSDALASEGYLTRERLAEVAAGLGLDWEAFRPRHGVRWALRPWIARARRRREPSSFLLVVAGRGDDPARDASPRRRSGAAARAWRGLLRLRYLLLERRRRRGPVRERVAGCELVVAPGVFSPKLFRTGQWLARFAANATPAGAAVLDLGTGSGAAALAAAGRAARVVAVDVNPAAAACARANAERNGLADRVEVRAGDLFGPLAPGERFDVVLFNPPFYRGVPADAADAAWRSVDVPERFARGLPDRLTAGGRALVVLSSDCDVDGWLAPARAAGCDVRVVARRDLVNEELVLYRIAPPGAGRPSRTEAHAP